MWDNETNKDTTELEDILPQSDGMNAGGGRGAVSVLIRDALARSIQGGRFGTGAKLPTARELSKHYGVGVATVGRVYAQLEKEGLVTTRVGSGTFVAEAVPTAQKLTVHLCVHPTFLANQRHELAFPRLQGIITAAQARGVVLQLATTAADFDFSGGQGRAEGFIFFDRHYPEDGFGEIASHARRRGLPACVAHYSDGNLPVTNDGHEEAFFLATEHLLALGHRRVGLLNHREFKDPNPVPMQNRAGYLKAFRRRRLSPPPDLYREAVFHANELWEEETAAALDQLLASRPRMTALVCHNDVCACFVLGLLGEIGVRVPEDLSVVGFDNRDRAATSRPPLTTVDPFRFRQGEAALNFVADCLIAGQATLSPVRPKLVVRESTSPLVQR